MAWFKRLAALAALVALGAALGGCARPAELDPNHKASTDAWKEVELKKLEAVELVDMKALPGQTIQGLASLKVSSTKGGGNATPPPAYKPPPSPWDRVWSFLETAVGVGGRTVTTVVGIQEGASVLRAGYSAAGDRTVVGRDLNGGPGAGSDRDKPWTNFAAPEGQ